MSTYLIPLLVIVVLVAINGLFVAAEFAIVASRRTRLEVLASGGNAPARFLLRVLDHPVGKDRYIAIAQLGITLASIGLGMYAEPQVASWLYGPLEQYGGLGYALSHTLGTIIALSFITYLHVVFGEMIPKALALQRPEDTSVRATPMMRAFGALFAPLVSALNFIALALMRLLGIREPGQGERLYSTRELAFLAKESERGGQLEFEQRILIENIFALDERTAGQLMTPRMRLEAISARARRDEVRALLTRSRRSRFPVYGENLDDILGVLHVKDFIRAEVQGRFPEVARLARPMASVTVSTTGEELLEVFKRERVHAALVVDEFGGTAGFVTLHDLIEDVVEDVRPDAEDVWVRREEDGSLVARGDTPLSDLREEYDLPFTSENAETVAGFFLEHFASVPPAGTSLVVGRYELTAEALEGLAITRVRVRPLKRA